MSIDQKLLFAIVTVPYELQDVSPDGRDDLDDKIGEDLRHMVSVRELTGATVELLDEHGFAELVADYVKKGVVA